jgi:hypothetical protein
MIYFTLSHFNSSIRDFFLTKGGYTSQLDYELSTENPLFEIYWNSKTESFELDASSIPAFNDSEYIHDWVSIHSLSNEVKEYLWDTYLSHKYDNFDIYLMQKYITSTILVYVPIRQSGKIWSDHDVKSIPSEMSYYNDWFTSNEIKIQPIQPTQPTIQKPNYHFQLNPKTHNSYVLFPVDTIEQFKKKYPERFDRKGWNLFNDERVVYYSKTYNGFIVSKKYKNDLLQLGATMT